MARKPRHDHPGAWHHVFHRGARKAPIFHRDDHCVSFLDTVAEAVSAFGMEVHGYALMPNHYHLLVRVPLGNLSRCMRHINASYTQRINRMHAWDGPLFRGRFGSKRVVSSDWLTYLLAYIHLNPVKANLVSRPEEPCWTSHRAYLGLEPTPAWLTTELMLERLDGPEGVDGFVRQMHIGRTPWPKGFDTAAGWSRPAALLPAPPAEHRPPLQPLTPDDVMARVLAITGLDESAIMAVRRGPGGNPARRFFIWALWRGALLTHVAIGRRLGMTGGHVGRVLSRFRQGDLGEPISAWQAAWRAIEEPPEA